MTTEEKQELVKLAHSGVMPLSEILINYEISWTEFVAIEEEVENARKLS